MSDELYVGFRIEIAGRLLILKNLIKKYNSKHKDTQLFDLFSDGKITIEKKNGMIMAHGVKSDKGPTGLVNFAVMSRINMDQQEVERIIKIINVLGNDRLIREKVSTFTTGHSALNNIPELVILQTAFLDLDGLMPGFIRNAWYYAPEAIGI